MLLVEAQRSYLNPLVLNGFMWGILAVNSGFELLCTGQAIGLSKMPVVPILFMEVATDFSLAKARDAAPAPGMILKDHGRIVPQAQPDKLPTICPSLRQITWIWPMGSSEVKQ